MKINSFIDATNLKADSTKIDIENLCKEAIENRYAAVCILPEYVRLASECLADSEIAVCTVVGFPLGAVAAEIKNKETAFACSAGANEIDMVINIAAFKNKEYERVRYEIELLAETCKKSGALLKVIVEACLLSDDEKITVCHIINKTSADYIKTSTGYSKSGATIADVKLFRKHCIKKIKAAGGIQDYAFAGKLIAAGADRIGTSKARQITA